MKKVLLSLLFFPLIAFAELPQELSMDTDVGKVAITSKECPIKNTYGFTFRAYATEFSLEGQKVHEGCWQRKEDIVYIWFYNEPEPIIASYKDYYFKEKVPL